MSEQQKELLEMADTLDRLVERGRQPNVREPLVQLENAANETGRSWSGSWLGYHAYVYYEGLRPPPGGAHFSPDEGMRNRFVRNTTGDWEEFDPEMVKATIYERAGNPDLEVSHSLCEEAVREFESHKMNALSIIESVSSSDNYLKRCGDELNNLRILGQSEVVNAVAPKRLSSSDMQALSQGLRVPPHIAVLAQVREIRGTLETVEKLAMLTRQSGSHLLRRQRQARRSRTVGINVFIGHGHSLIWRELKDFIESRLRLPVDEFNRVPVAGVTNTARLSEMLDAAAIAFLVMTGEDEQPDGKLRARMNVVHEAGLFQGRLGFDRTIVLLEEGCEEFSNIEGLGHIQFPPGDIRAAFEEIREVLEREGVLSVIAHNGAADVAPA